MAAYTTKQKPIVSTSNHISSFIMVNVHPASRRESLNNLKWMTSEHNKISFHMHFISPFRDGKLFNAWVYDNSWGGGILESVPPPLSVKRHFCKLFKRQKIVKSHSLERIQWPLANFVHVMSKLSEKHKVKQFKISFMSSILFSGVVGQHKKMWIFVD